MSNTERIIRLKTVLDRTGLSRSTIYRKIAEGTFPSQVKISIHGAGWHESAINRWIAAARMIGVGRTKLYELISNGELETIKIGKATRITTASLHRLVERHRALN